MTLLRPLLLAALLGLLALAGGCTSDTACPQCQDIVTTIPWSAPEAYQYQLKDGDTVKGQATLAVKQEGGRVIFTQSFKDGQGNSDESSVTADATTLKPIASARTVIDSELRRVLETSYEDVDKSECSSLRVVRITQTTYEPPDDTTPQSTRSNPLCVPEHAYDNDSSLFIWRTITFEKGYTVSYKTVLANRRETQTVTLTVRDQAKIQTAAGEADAWVVDIAAPTGNQRAWFATTPDHRLLRYNNDSLVFEIQE